MSRAAKFTALALGASMLACFFGGEDEDKTRPPELYTTYSAWRKIELYGDLRLRDSTLPGAEGERVVFFEEQSDPVDAWWVLDVEDAGDDKRDFTLSIDYSDFGGCSFEGSGSSFQGTFDQGSCVIPRPEGHVYFLLTDTATYNLPTPDFFGTQTTIFNGVWLEERAGFYLSGEGSLYLRHLETSENFESKPREVAAYRGAIADRFEACYLVDLRGEGEVEESEDAEVCEAASAWTGEPFTAYLDATGRMSYVPLDQNAADQRLHGVPSSDEASHTIFSGVAVGPHERYTFDFERGSFRFDRTFIHTEENKTSQCRIIWTGSFTDCPD